MTLVMKSRTGALVDGAFSLTFGDYEKVSQAQVMFDNPSTNDFVYGATVSIGTNIVTVTVKKINTTTATVTSWATAGTDTITATVIADCI